MKPQQPRRRPGELTARETQILRLLASGLNAPQIAKQLFLSPHTVRTHIANARRALGARSRIHAVAIVIERGLLEARESISPQAQRGRSAGTPNPAPDRADRARTQDTR